MKKNTRDNLFLALALIVYLAAIIILMNLPLPAHACGRDNNVRLSYQHNSQPMTTRDPYIFDGVGLEGTQYVSDRWYISGGLFVQLNPYFNDEHAWRATFETGFEWGW